MRLKAFFRWPGAKHKIAGYYPPPLHDAPLIEMCAGSAGYACRYHAHRVTLVDADPGLCAVWDYLIGVSRRELAALPITDDAAEIAPCPEARELIRLWRDIRPGRGGADRVVLPRGYDSRFVWGAYSRARLEAQVDSIRHWRVVCSSYADYTPPPGATLFVDPPYVGVRMKYGCRITDHEALGAWCRAHRGRTIVCGGRYDNWLPFHHLTMAAGTTKKYEERVWVSAALNPPDIAPDVRRLCKDAGIPLKELAALLGCPVNRVARKHTTREREVLHVIRMAVDRDPIRVRHILAVREHYSHVQVLSALLDTGYGGALRQLDPRSDRERQHNWPTGHDGGRAARWAAPGDRAARRRSRARIPRSAHDTNGG